MRNEGREGDERRGGRRRRRTIREDEQRGEKEEQEETERERMGVEREAPFACRYCHARGTMRQYSIIRSIIMIIK